MFYVNLPQLVWHTVRFGRVGHFRLFFVKDTISYKINNEKMFFHLLQQNKWISDFLRRTLAPSKPLSQKSRIHGKLLLCGCLPNMLPNRRRKDYTDHDLYQIIIKGYVKYDNMAIQSWKSIVFFCFMRSRRNSWDQVKKLAELVFNAEIL